MYAVSLNAAGCLPDSDFYPVEFDTLKREDSKRTPEARRMSIELRTARALKTKGI